MCFRCIQKVHSHKFVHELKIAIKAIASVANRVEEMEEEAGYDVL